MESTRPTPPEIESLLSEAAKCTPGTKFTVSAGGMQAGNWWVDCSLEDRFITVEWRPDEGFGIYDSEGSGYGDKPAEIYRVAHLAAVRLGQLLEAPDSTRVNLQRLRELYSVSQADVAARLGVQQAAVSKLESRGDIKIGSLMSYIEALGGTVEIRVHFSDSDLPICLGKDEREPVTSQETAGMPK